jgi:hypothetical protein
MTADAPSRLADAAAQRANDAQTRARRALAELDSADEKITFAAVARRARVSRQFLYSRDTLRTEIAQLRTTHARSSSALPPHIGASDDSLRTRLRAALDDNRRLRSELTRLRAELAVALGRNRELELDRRAHTT